MYILYVPSLLSESLHYYYKHTSNRGCRCGNYILFTVHWSCDPLHVDPDQNCFITQDCREDAFIQLMELALSDFDLSVVTTDGHLGIAAHMRTAYPHVTHNQVSDVRNFVCSYLCHVIFKNFWREINFCWQLVHHQKIIGVWCILFSNPRTDWVSHLFRHTKG